MTKYDYQSNWISVDKMVPPNEQTVLVTYVISDEYLKTKVGVARIVNYDHINKKSVWTGPGRVTHWMPLPPAAM